MDFGTESLISLIVGVILGAFFTYFVTTRFRFRHRLRFSLKELGRDASDEAQFELRVKNVGFADLSVADANATSTPGVPMPRIDFGGGKIIDWDNPNSSSYFYVPLAFAANDHKVHINIHRLARRHTAKFIIDVRFTNPDRPLSRDNIYFFPGAIQDTKIRTRGLLKPPPSYLKS